MTCRKWPKYFLMAFVVVCGCSTDLYTKNLAREGLGAGESVPVIDGYLDLRYSENRSASFSLLSGIDESVRRPLLAGFQIVGSMVLVVLIFLWRKKTLWVLLPLCLVLAGAVGNAVNRVRWGYVVDFVFFHVRDHFSWPIFNLADVLISAGLGLFLLQMLIRRAAD